MAAHRSSLSNVPLEILAIVAQKRRALIKSLVLGSKYCNGLN